MKEKNNKTIAVKTVYIWPGNTNVRVTLLGNQNLLDRPFANAKVYW